MGLADQLKRENRGSKDLHDLLKVMWTTGAGTKTGNLGDLGPRLRLKLVAK